MRSVAAAIFALSLLSPAAAGPSLAPRDFVWVYGPEPVTIGDTDWNIWGLLEEPRCIARQQEHGTVFAVGRLGMGSDKPSSPDKPRGMFLILYNPSWAPPLSEKQPMKIEVKWASWSIDTVGRVGILDAVIKSDYSIVVMGLPQNDIESLIGRAATRVEFAVPDRVVRPGGEAKLWVKGFGRQLAPALKRCTDAIERFLPQPVVDRTEKGGKTSVGVWR